MSARLFQRDNGEYSFVSTESEWHKPFTKHKTIDYPMTAEQAMAETGMADMELLETPLLAEVKVNDTSTTNYRMPRQKGVVLHDKGTDSYRPVTTVGRNRKVTQFGDLAYPMDALLDVSRGTIETFGLLDPGDEWFCTIRLPENVTVGGDEHVPYVWGRDSLTGNYIVQHKLFRVCCGNTNLAALAEAREGGYRYAYVMRHTSLARVDIEAIRAAINLSSVFVQELDAIARIMLDQEFVNEEFANLTDALFGVPDPRASSFAKTTYRKRFNRLNSLFSDPDLESMATTWRDGRPTKWTAFQAISEYVDWMAPVKGRDVGIRRLERTMDRQVQSIKTTALAALL